MQILSTTVWETKQEDRIFFKSKKLQCNCHYFNGKKGSFYFLYFSLTVKTGTSISTNTWIWNTCTFSHKHPRVCWNCCLHVMKCQLLTFWQKQAFTLPCWCFWVAYIPINRKLLTLIVKMDGECKVMVVVVVVVVVCVWGGLVS